MAWGSSVSSSIFCVKSCTANDACMRDLDIFAPADCIVSNTVQENEQALRQLETVLKGNVATSERLVFHRRRLRR